MRTPPSNTDNFDQEPQAGGLQLGDIYYILFRHKWKILICAVAGLVAAVALFRLKPPLYNSQAKLMVHYVVDPRVLPGPGGDVRTPDTAGASIMNAEIEILTSFDLLRE